VASGLHLAAIVMPFLNPTRVQRNNVNPLQSVPAFAAVETGSKPRRRHRPLSNQLTVRSAELIWASAVRSGSQADVSLCNRHLRFTLESKHRRCKHDVHKIQPCRLCRLTVRFCSPMKSTEVPFDTAEASCEASQFVRRTHPFDCVLPTLPGSGVP
jgi:hypothetical protein